MTCEIFKIIRNFLTLPPGYQLFLVLKSKALLSSSNDTLLRRLDVFGVSSPHLECTSYVYDLITIPNFPYGKSTRFSR